MNLVTAFSLFSLVILLYWVITELFTVLFHLTGLPDDKARFQVISLLTGCGFTTRESEMMLSNVHRRRLARITMLFGYVFNITIVSAFINVFLSLKVGQVQNFFIGVLIPLCVAALIMVFMRVPKVRAWGDRLLLRVADRIIGVDSSFNSVQLLDSIGSEAIARVIINHIPEEYQGLSLSANGLKQNTGIMVMLVEKPGQHARSAGPDTVIEPGDQLTVFGRYENIRRAFHARERFTDD